MGANVLIMAGGTGGHVFPALACAREFQNRGYTVHWLGTPRGIENELVPNAGLPLHLINVTGLRGKSKLSLLKAPFVLLKAVMQARRIIRELKPVCVLGFGGYVTGPGGVAAKLAGVPVIVHEQNAVAGTANKCLAKMSRRVLSGFPGVLPKGEAMGNPVRADLCALPDPAERYAGRTGPLRVLVVGGSLGAQALNTTVPQALARLPLERRPTIVHQAGEQHLPALQQAYAQAGVQADCRAFIDDMAGAMADADLLICRAGAMTVSEVAAAGVAALFVPFPHAIDDHQTANARFLSDAQAAWLQPQTAMTPEWLADWLSQRTRQELEAVAVRARAHARPDAAAHIADVCEQAAGRSS